MTGNGTKALTRKLPLGVIERPGMPFILAVDPGGTTGLAWYDPTTGEVECMQLGPGSHHKDLRTVVTRLSAHATKAGSYLVIVYEQFEFRQDYGTDKIFRSVQALVGKLKAKSIVKLNEVVGALEEMLKLRTNRDNLVLISREYIGVLELCAQEDKTIQIYSQSASEALWFIKDVKLTALGWYKPTAGWPHARDALRHLARFLVVTLRVREPITTAWFGKKPATRKVSSG